MLGAFELVGILVVTGGAALAVIAVLLVLLALYNAG